jgi:hypothetical protein
LHAGAVAVVGKLRPRPPYNDRVDLDSKLGKPTRAVSVNNSEGYNIHNRSHTAPQEPQLLLSLAISAPHFGQAALCGAIIAVGLGAAD